MPDTHEWPTFTEEQIAFLEKTFPARCKSPSETLEEHLLYAGYVSLIQLMRDRRCLAQGVSLDDLDEEEQIAEAVMALRVP